MRHVRSTFLAPRLAHATQQQAPSVKPTERRNDGVRWEEGGRAKSPIMAAIIGNIGTLIAFQLGENDPAELEPAVAPYPPDTLTWLSTGQVVVRIGAGGEHGEPFLGETLDEVGLRYVGRQGAVLEQSRRRYAQRREVVEEKIARWNAR